MITRSSNATLETNGWEKVACVLSHFSCVWLIGGDSGKESSCQCRRPKKWEFDPWIGKIPRRRVWQPTPVFFPGESHGQSSLVSYGPWSAKRKHEGDFYWSWVNPGIDWSEFRVICVFLVRGRFTRVQACVANWCQHLLRAGSATVSDAVISGEIVLLNVENDCGKYHAWNIQSRKTVSLLF